MSNQIPVAFEQKYARDFLLLSQQKGSRLRNTVRDDVTDGGKYFYFDRVGKTSMLRKTSRHMDTPTVETPHSRRRVGVEDFVWADLIDRADVIKMTKSPQNAYMTTGMRAAGRQIDDVIIAAAIGDSTSTDESDTASTVVLPSSQKIATGSGGLTLVKLLQAKEILDGNEVDDEDRFLVYSAKQGTNLLSTTQITSADYNTVKALVQGQINTFLNFTFIRSERLAKVSTTRRCIAFQKNAIGLYFPMEITSRVDERPDKNYSTQVYVDMALGAARVEEEGVVQIDCTET